MSPKTTQFLCSFAEVLSCPKHSTHVVTAGLWGLPLHYHWKSFLKGFRSSDCPHSPAVPLLPSASSPELQPLFTPPLPCSSSPHSSLPQLASAEAPGSPPGATAVPHCLGIICPFVALSLPVSPPLKPSVLQGGDSPCPGFMLSPVHWRRAWSCLLSQSQPVPKTSWTLES